MFGLAILFGGFVGFALGLTGGGGGIFAVPLLVYGLGVGARSAVGVSLAAVGGTALFGVAPRIVRGEVELRTGILFAVAGMIGAPVGTYLSSLLPETTLLMLFAFLMLVVAWRMWSQARTLRFSPILCATSEEQQPKQSTCQRDEHGTLRLTSPCAVLLAAIGLTTGILSGMFGVGGGFVIVPALVLFSGMKIHNAVATSLLVIFLVSVSGVSSYLAAGNKMSWEITAQFLVGGFGGMWLGGLVAKQLKGPTLQKIFATGVILVALFVISKSLFA